MATRLWMRGFLGLPLLLVLCGALNAQSTSQKWKGQPEPPRGTNDWLDWKAANRPPAIRPAPTPSLTPQRGAIELIDRNKSFINVRDSEACPLYHITAASKLSKGSSPCKLADLHVGEIVLVTWAFQPFSSKRKDIRTLVCLPTLMPVKLKVGQVGYLALQSEDRHYICEYLDKEKVLIREVLIERTYRPVYAPAGVIVQEVRTQPREGASFFLAGVNPSDYAVGREAVLEGEWRVETTASATVTKSTAIYTSLVSTEGRKKLQQKSKVKAEIEDEKETAEDVIISKQKRDLKIDAKEDLATQAKGVSSAQSTTTASVSGFVLIPATTAPIP